MDVFERADALGPGKVVQVREPSLGLQAVLVVDNVARGPSIGGLRMAPDVSVEECTRLARAMTLKNSAAGLAHGGGKSVLWGDPRFSSAPATSLSAALAEPQRRRRACSTRYRARCSRSASTPSRTRGAHSGSRRLRD